MKLSRFYILYNILFLLYISNLIFKSSILELIISWYTFITFILSWKFATRLFKVISTIFALSGIIMSLSVGVPLYELPGQFQNNLPMLIFLSMLPWMASAFIVSEYDRTLQNMLNSKSPFLSDIYGRGVATTYSLLLFINISSIYIMQQILLDKLKDVNDSIRNDFIIKVTLRAFALAIIWSPMEIIVGITIDATNISLLSYLPWLLLISFTMAIIDTLISSRTYKMVQIPILKNGYDRDILNVLTKLFFILLTFFIIIITINYFVDLSFILTVSLIIFPFTFIWSIMMQRRTTFLKFGWESWRSHNNSMQNLTVLFLSLALFSEGFIHTAIPNLLRNMTESISNYTILIFLFMTILYFVLALIGIHPVATIAILIDVIQPLFDIINPMSIGIVLIVSALATSACSPYGVCVTITTQMLKVSPYHVSKTNIGFSITMSLIGILVAMLLV